MKTLREKFKKFLKNRVLYNLFFLSFFLTVSYLILSQFYALAISNTPSMGTYFFINQRYSTVIKDGRAVVFPAPKRFYEWRKYYEANGISYPKKLNLVKYVGCTAGQLLNTINRKDYCNGRFISEIPKYAVLIPEPHMKIKGFPIWHDYKIPAGFFFAASPDKYGLDSRYFGLVKDSIVTYNTVPLFPKSVIQ